MLTLAFLSHHSNHLISKNIEKIVNYGLDISFLVVEAREVYDNLKLPKHSGRKDGTNFFLNPTRKIIFLMIFELSVLLYLAVFFYKTLI